MRRVRAKSMSQTGKSIVLGLDLSSVNTGYSVFEATYVALEDPSPQLIAFGNITPKQTLNEQAKLETIYNLVDALIREHSIECVAIEDTYYSKNAKTFKILVRISGVVILAAQKNGCEIYLYPPSTVKKTFFGNGKANKKDMIKTAIEIYKIDPDSIEDNAADAIAVGHTHIQLMKEIMYGDFKR